MSCRPLIGRRTGEAVGSDGSAGELEDELPPPAGEGLQRYQMRYSLVHPGSRQQLCMAGDVSHPIRSAVHTSMAHSPPPLQLSCMALRTYRQYCAVQLSEPE